jgi:hypothetical protein
MLRKHQEHDSELNVTLESSHHVAGAFEAEDYVRHPAQKSKQLE